MPVTETDLTALASPPVTTRQDARYSAGQRSIVVPPGSVFAASPSTVWPGVNAALFNRFSLMNRGTYRYVNVPIGVASGNIQVGVASMRHAAGSDYVTRIAHTGVVVTPAPGAGRFDIGSVTLGPGDYALFVWCDNTTAAINLGAASGFNATKLLFTGTIAGGLGANETQVSTTTRWLAGVTMDNDV